MRVVLFVPALDPRRVTKALSLPVDAVIIDLEDAVPAAQKAEARSVLAGLAAQVSGARCEVWVRINSPSNPEWREDLACAAAVGVQTVMVPKAETVAQLTAVAQAFSELRGAPPGLVPLVESARGVLAAAELATAPQVRRLGLGPLDLAADLRLPRESAGSGAIDHARIQLVYASAAAGIAAPIDGVYPRFDDPAGLERDTAAGRALGMGGRMIIHPAQIEPVRQAFRPSADDLAWARRVLAAAGQESGAVRLDGQMVDRPVVLAALQVLQDAGESTDGSKGGVEP